MKRNSIRPLLALDFGTANCLVIRNRKGIVLREPTVVAVSLKEKKVIAVGAEAKVMLGKEPKDIIARRPLRNGGISNFQLAYALLSKFLDQSLGRWRIVRPEVIVSVPSKLNSIEERALVKALEKYGVYKTHLFPEAIAAAIGAKLPIEKPQGSMIVNLGGGTAEIALMSLGGIVSSRSHVGTGDAITYAIQNHITEVLRIEIGELSTEQVKMQIGNALHSDDPKEFIVSGKELSTGKIVTRTINSNDILAPIREVLHNLIVSIQDVLQEAPPELISDLTEHGVALSGGTSLLQNIDIFLTKSLDLPFYIVENPMECVVRGLNTALKKNTFGNR